MKLKLLALAAAASFAAPSFAADVVLNGFVFNPAEKVTVGVPDYTGPAGQMEGTLDGNSFLTYCAELTQSIQFGQSISYTVVDGEAAWGAAKSMALNKLMSSALAGGVPMDAKQSAAVQAAVWEVLYETSGTYDLTAGSFVATSADAGTQGYINAINWAGIMSMHRTHSVDQLANRSRQDLLMITPVPEPSTYAMLLAGLAGVGFVARRRSAQK
jgi:hypothetical protein